MAYQKQVVRNTQALAGALQGKGYKMVTGTPALSLTICCTVLRCDTAHERSRMRRVLFCGASLHGVQMAILVGKVVYQLRASGVAGGSDNHLLLWDMRGDGVTGSKMQKACDLAHITLNMNSVVGDVSALTPGGVRIGMPAMTSRGLLEPDFEQVRPPLRTS